MLTRKALFFKVCMDISYPKKTILTYFSLTAMHLHLYPKGQSFSR
ncbi:hypothetical protein [Helicobacter pylori]|nr:hypothetical protein [Helicobacter pylori]